MASLRAARRPRSVRGRRWNAAASKSSCWRSDMPTPDLMESRLAEIEIKLSYSEDLLEELNRTVFRQQQQIEQLQQELRALRQQLQADDSSAGSSDLRDETHPH